MGDPIAAMIGAFCVVSAALVAILAILTGRRRRREQHRMREWADRNGWTMTAHASVGWGHRLPGGNKHGVGATFSTVSGGRRISVAEYSVTDASDGTTTNTHYYVVMVAVLNRAFPPTAVAPRGRVSRLKNSVLGSAENATGHPDFDRAFRIDAAGPGSLRQWFSEPLIAAHLTGQVPTPWSVEGTELLCYRPGRLQVEEIPGHAAAVLPLADLLDHCVSR